MKPSMFGTTACRTRPMKSFSTGQQTNTVYSCQQIPTFRCCWLYEKRLLRHS